MTIKGNEWLSLCAETVKDGKLSIAELARKTGYDLNYCRQRAEMFRKEGLAWAKEDPDARTFEVQVVDGGSSRQTPPERKAFIATLFSQYEGGRE